MVAASAFRTCRGSCRLRITLVGNVNCGHSSETHHALSLESLGHEVVRLQEGKARGEEILEEGLLSDMLVFVHTHGWRTEGIALEKVLQRLERTGIPTVTYHLDLWLGLDRQRDLEQDPFYRSIGWFFTVDPKMADWFCTHTAVKGRFIPAGVYGPECYISSEPSPHANEVVFVGSRNYHHQHAWRWQLLDWLRETYGSRFTHVGGDGDTGTLRGDALNRAYANSKVAVGDTLCLGFDYPLYHSDRLWEASGRGAAQIFPRIARLEQWFKEGEHLLYYDFGDFDGLREKIDWMLENDTEREQMRRSGHEMVKATGTYKHRWAEILETVFSA